jgi:hypothetical protein
LRLIASLDEDASEAFDRAISMNEEAFPMALFDAIDEG